MYCPFCGVNVPEIEINEDAVKNHKYMNQKICIIVIYGDEKYCCDCLPPPNLDGSQLIDIEYL
jgi:hypothetical protein